MVNFDNVTRENLKEQNPAWSQIPDHPHRLFIITVSVSAKTNTLYYNKLST